MYQYLYNIITLLYCIIVLLYDVLLYCTLIFYIPLNSSILNILQPLNFIPIILCSLGR